MKIWSLPKHENLTTGKTILWKRGEISSLFHNVFNRSLISKVQLHIYLLNVVVRIIFSTILKIWYVEVRISRSISESPLEFEITKVDCIFKLQMFATWTGFAFLLPFSVNSYGKFQLQSTLVISKSNGLSEILRDIRTSTYQICRIEKQSKSNNNIRLMNI